MVTKNLHDKIPEIPDHVDADGENKIIDLVSIIEGVIWGYAEYTYILHTAKINNFGEGLAENIPYERLMGIDRLVDMF